MGVTLAWASALGSSITDPLAQPSCLSGERCTLLGSGWQFGAAGRRLWLRRDKRLLTGRRKFRWGGSQQVTIEPHEADAGPRAMENRGLGLQEPR